MRIRRICGFCLFFAILVFCVLLPLGVNRLRDFHQLNLIQTAQMEPVTLDNNSQIPFSKRISLISSKMYYGDVQLLGFDSGMKYTMTTAIENAMAQIDTLYSLGLLPEPSSSYEHPSDQIRQLYISGIQFAVANDDPACNLILWHIEAVSDCYTVSLDIDDDTGKVLMFGVAANATQDWFSYLELPTAAESWSSYLELSIQTSYAPESPMKLSDNALFYLQSILDNTESASSVASIQIFRVKLIQQSAPVSYGLYCDTDGFGVIVE